MTGFAEDSWAPRINLSYLVKFLPTIQEILSPGSTRTISRSFCVEGPHVLGSVEVFEWLCRNSRVIQIPMIVRYTKEGAILIQRTECPSLRKRQTMA
ncbi:hypothetical protein BJX66DRAFT_302183 [Aspergillus keveii]|uniref:Uncharacterized protein n=1 Tax=Aspergillus keveii TaxID=714993 RepID=A0ABR4G8I0_9EURO